WGGSRPIFVETAILYQSGIDRMVDEVWEVTAPFEERVARVMARDGIDREAVCRRIESQKIVVDSPHENVKVIINDGFTPLLPQIIDCVAHSDT
ncbi:MAG: dephospho-CoA kinase, partial [Muribaculaceae bacterium]|nr:dephospho-CoA kinase [Muribaculaceae bacterium]